MSLSMLQGVIMEILDEEKARFRIIIRDLKTGKSRTKSLKDGNHSLEDVEKKVVSCFTKR